VCVVTINGTAVKGTGIAKGRGTIALFSMTGNYGKSSQRRNSLASMGSSPNKNAIPLA